LFNLLLIFLLLINIATFLYYGYDKRQAKKDRWRIPEKRLHTLSLLGGWPAALVAQKLFRHKSAKTSFQVFFWLTVFLNVACLILLWWYWDSLATTFHW